MNWRVPLTKLELSDEEVESALEAVRSEWLTMGPRTQALEAAFAEYTGSEHVVAVSSGTAALHLACLAAGVGPDDEVIVPAMTFVATAHAPRNCGATAVLCDSVGTLDPALDPAAVEALINDRTRAVIAVHLCGYPAAIEELRAICERRGVALIEDCAQAAGARYGPGASRVGKEAIAGCFSFFSKTQLGVGEGGAVTAQDADVADRVRSLRSHAMTTVTWDRHRGHAETYDVTDLGFNYRIDELRAALAHARLEALDGGLARLREVAEGYRRRLADVDGIELPFAAEAVEWSGHFAFPVLLADLQTRDAVRERLHEEGVQTTFYPALTQLAEYRDAAPDGAARAEQFADRHCALPLSPSLADEELDIVAGALADSLAA
ncbi:MAG: DegT/DnrJ/EryC1/StrS family aminotransferase [Solirubrobacterales bacterium]